MAQEAKKTPLEMAKDKYEIALKSQKRRMTRR